MTTTFLSALDLGQTTDPSAFVIAECSSSPDPDPDRKGYSLNRYDVRHIHRWDLGTKYTQIVSDLKSWYTMKPNLPGSTLMVDGTGVGRPVVDMLRESGISADVRAYTITAGFNEGEYKDGWGTVPKLHLCGATQAVVQQRRVRYADGLPLGPVLEKEMETFEVKVTENRNETFASWREGTHDDILLALALLVWYGERNYFGPAIPYPRPKSSSDQQIEAMSKRDDRYVPSYLRRKRIG
jgi:hypothetical protein